MIINDESNIDESNNKPSQKDASVWKHKSFDTSSTHLESFNIYREGLETDQDLKKDANYKKVSLSTISSNWSPPIIQTYKNIPNGLNDKTGVESDETYSPSKSKEYIYSTSAKITDILTPPPPLPIPKPVRPKESFETIQEGFSVPDKQKAFINAWKTWKDSKNMNNLRTAIVETVNSVYESFYIPELIALSIVNSSYGFPVQTVYYDESHFTESEKGRFAEYTNDVSRVTKHFNQVVLTVFSFFAAFNWWYLLIYTNHYFDIDRFLESKFFSPVIWIVGPALSPVMLLNYFILGKRLELPFYEWIVQPVIENKSLYFTLYLLVFMAIYMPMSNYYSKTMNDITHGKPNLFYKVVLGIGCLYYFFKVAFNMNIQFNLIKLFSSFSLLLIFVLILFIIIVLACKISVFLIIMFFTFYSYWAIIVLGGGPQNVPLNIVKMIADTTEGCEIPNPTKDIFISIKNWAKKNIANVFIFIIFFTLIVHLMADTEKKIFRPSVKDKCRTIYSFMLIGQILMVIWINKEIFSFKTISGAAEEVLPPNSPESNVLSNLFKSIFSLFKILFILPFTIIDYFITLLAFPFFKLLSIFGWDSSKWVDFSSSLVFARKPIIWFFNSIGLIPSDTATPSENTV